MQYNCKVRLKSTKDGKITAIHRNTKVKDSINHCKDILDHTKGLDLTLVMITGFTKEGYAHTSFSRMDNRGDGLLAIENLKNFLNNTETE